MLLCWCVLCCCAAVLYNYQEFFKEILTIPLQIQRNSEGNLKDPLANLKGLQRNSKGNLKESFRIKSKGILKGILAILNAAVLPVLLYYCAAVLLCCLCCAAALLCSVVLCCGAVPLCCCGVQFFRNSKRKLKDSLANPKGF